MQIVRFKVGDRTRYGVLEGATVVEYAGTPFTIFRRGRHRYPLKHVVLLAPVLPSKIVGIGPNYRDHATELGLAIPDEPVMLLQIVRFKVGDRTRYGVLEGATVVEYAGTPFTIFRRGRHRYPLKHVVLLAPVLPSKIVGIGPNYRDHATELGLAIPDEPVMLFKPTTTLVGPDDPIVYPSISVRVEHEAELAVVVKRRCRDVPAARAREYILGYTALNDVTARDLQEKDGQGTRAKAFDTFCPIGPCVATDIDPSALTIEAYVNGELRQSAGTKEMVFPIEDLLARVSQV